ncbi:MAG: hypothetical protein MI741_00085 [Rhodospirillales bacterium]|nr:hypothetical protein [Rhodospirillales bacterium]
MRARWLIGGPARCGKSALAEALSRRDGSLAVMRVDALLHRYRGDGPFRTDTEARAFLQTYLERPRFMDPQRSETLRPMDDFPAPSAEILDEASPRAGMDGLGVIAAALDAMARMRGRPGWVALDLHPEVHFRAYADAISELNLAVCVRDPLEAVAAALYWRTYPQRAAQVNRRLGHAAALWRLSVAIALNLREVFPDRVTLISSNDMFAGQAPLPPDLATTAADFARLFGGSPYFASRQTDGRLEFHCPDGSWRQLLDDDEIAAMEPLRRSWRHAAELIARRDTEDRSGWGLVETAVRWRPDLCKSTIDLVYTPKTALGRQARQVRTLLRKLA